MRKTKIWLVLAAVLVLGGCILFTVVMANLGWDFSKLATANYESNNYVVSENFKNISIITDTADVVLVPSESPKASVSCYEQKNIKHSVNVRDGALVIEANDTRKWYEYIGINFATPKITVSLPIEGYNTLAIKSDTGDVEIPKDFNFENIDVSVSTGEVKNFASTSETVKIKTSTGDICVESIAAGALDLSVSTGKVEVIGVTTEGDVKVGVSTGKANLADTKCRNVISSGNTGDISLDNVIAVEKFSIERSTGDVKFNGSDAAEIYVKTDTGDVTGNLLTEKVFVAETDTGKVDVPKTAIGGRCEIKADTGHINISISH